MNHCWHPQGGAQRARNGPNHANGLLSWYGTPTTLAAWSVAHCRILVSAARRKCPPRWPAHRGGRNTWWMDQEQLMNGIADPIQIPHRRRHNAVVPPTLSSSRIIVRPAPRSGQSSATTSPRA